MMKEILTVKVFVIFLALTKVKNAFRIPNQDEITNAISTAMLRQAGANLAKKFMQKFDGNYGAPTAGSGATGRDILSTSAGNADFNFGARNSGTRGNGLLNAVLEGVGNGLTASFGGSSAGLPGNGGILNTLTQGLRGNSVVPTSSGPGGGFINTLTQGLGGNSVASAAGGPSGFLNTVLSGAGSSVPSSAGGPTAGQGTGFLGRLLGNIGTSYGGSNTNSAGTGLVNRILRETASALNSHRTGNTKEGFRMR
uniref:Putative glycine rich protein n=1 Tax=Rhipicephalus pulchellus TaxID=72859 RepID=L7LVZ0_RHIPC